MKKVKKISGKPTTRGERLAEKHGIYSCGLTAEERRTFSKISIDSLDDEIRMTKIRLRRAFRWEERILAAKTKKAKEGLLEITQVEVTTGQRGDEIIDMQKVTRAIKTTERTINEIINQLTKLVNQKALLEGDSGEFTPQERAALARAFLAEARSGSDENGQPKKGNQSNTGNRRKKA